MPVHPSLIGQSMKLTQEINCKNSDYEYTEAEIQVKNLHILNKLLNQSLLHDELDDSDDEKEYITNSQQTVKSSDESD